MTTRQQFPPFSLNEVEMIVFTDEHKCVSCGAKLQREGGLPPKVKHYDHDGGWRLSDLSGKQWLYIVCPGCGYQNSLTKLGHEKI